MNKRLSIDLTLPYLRISLLFVLLTCLSIGIPAAYAKNDSENQKEHPKRIPLKVLEYELLEFGKVVAGGGNKGKVTIDPVNGSKTVTHGIVDLGGYHGPAKFLISGQPNARFTIHLRSRGKLTANRKKTKAKLKNLKSHPDKFGRLGPDGKAWVMVGGEMWLGAQSGSGQYTGRFAIDVDYQYAKRN